MIDRKTNFALSDQQQTELEDLCGFAVLKALIDFEFPDGEPEFTSFMMKELKQHESDIRGYVKDLPWERLVKKNENLFK